jgi:hypothetical protein
MIDLLLVNGIQIIFQDGTPGGSALKLVTWSSISRVVFLIKRSLLKVAFPSSNATYVIVGSDHAWVTRWRSPP